ncbi:MAG: 30S ribosomal protein S20 [Candidatus Omnitrophota bacterium]
MPQRKTAKKDLKKNVKRKRINLLFKTKLKKTLKKLRKSLEEKDTASLDANLKTSYSVLDKAVSKNILHRNTASRRKSRLTKLVASLKGKK